MKWKVKNKWRKATIFSLDGLEDLAAELKKHIAEGYKYHRGFVAIGHRHGYNGDDFMQNCMTIVFYLMRVPRIVKRVNSKHAKSTTDK